MEKTIAVVDEYGNSYEATWPRRAEGLVRHGRARFVDSHTICLARPPYHNYVEDTEMSEEYTVNQETGEVIENLSGAKAPAFTMEYVLIMLERIQHDHDYVLEAIAKVGNLDSMDGPCLQIDTRGEAIGNIVAAREETNRSMIALLNRMYDDLRPDKKAAQSSKPSIDPERLLNLAQNGENDEIQTRAMDLLSKLLD